ncbi:MAG: hypothetical protein IT203_05680 [Fimbriimonadaceae bacterium]|nr:hypothetical protein [Fimbriimonadaceae bacterium]
MSQMYNLSGARDRTTGWRESMKFYNLKTRSHVDVPDSEVRKMKMVRKTKSGEQVRYALTATYQGSKLFKFINEATYKSSTAADA